MNFVAVSVWIDNRKKEVLVRIEINQHVVDECLYTCALLRFLELVAFWHVCADTMIT